jgi:hypothetical protein
MTLAHLENLQVMIELIFVQMAVKMEMTLPFDLTRMVLMISYHLVQVM